MDKIEELKKELDKQLGDREKQILLDFIEDIKSVGLLTVKAKQDELQHLYEKITQITENKTDKLIEAINELAKITKGIKLELPEKLKVEVEDSQLLSKKIELLNLPKFPDEIKLKKPDWWKQIGKQDLANTLVELVKAVKDNKRPNLEAYREPRKALAVRLVNRRGTDFYEALATAIGGMSRSSFPFENASGTAKAALVDVQGHIQADILSIVPGTGATNLGKQEDEAHSSGDVGVMALGVRKDAVTAIAADDDYHPLMISGEGGLWTEHVPNGVDSGNSSASTLLADAVFTGTGIDILSHDIVTITLDASHDSATDGISFQFSTDNSNWDDVYPFTYTAADGARRFQFPVTAQYFRVVYTNGGTNQTHFRMQTILHHNNSLTSIHRLVDDVSNDRSAQIMKTAIIAQKAGGGPGAGDFIAVQSTAGGNLKVSVEEEIAPSTLVAFVTDIPTAGTRVQLAANTIIAGVLEAPSTNTGNVFIGGSNVSSTVFGSELQPGQSIGVAIDDTDKIYIDAATSGDDVAFFGS